MAIIDNPSNIVIDQDKKINSVTKSSFKNQLLWDFSADLNLTKFPISIPKNVEYITVNAIYGGRGARENYYKSFGHENGVHIQRIKVSDLINNPINNDIISFGWYWGEIMSDADYIDIMNQFCEYWAGYSEPSLEFFRHSKGIILACSTLGYGEPYASLKYQIWTDKGDGVPYCTEEVRDMYKQLTGVDIPRE